MKIKLISLLLALTMVFGLAGCEGTDKPGFRPEPDSGVLFTDDLGREVSIPEELTRIVPTGPVAQILLYAIAPDMLVGLASRWSSSAQGIIPQEHLDLPYFGQLYNSANLNVEELAAAGPQLIVDIGQSVSGGEGDMQALEDQTQIPAVFISASLETMPETFRKLGRLLGREEKGEELARFCQRVWTRTQSILEQVGENKARALYVLGEKGLNVLARDSYHSQLIDMLTDNVAVVGSPSGKGTGNEVTMDQIALWDPDFVLFAPDSIYDTAAEDPVWSEISAIERGSYIKVPQGPDNWMGAPAAVQRYLGMIWLTAQLYPRYCDYDVRGEILEYYELFYHCALTEEQYCTLTEDAFLKN